MSEYICCLNLNTFYFALTMSTHGITMKVDEINTFQGGRILNENTVKKNESSTDTILYG